MENEKENITNNINSSPIGFFDSGIGGLSVYSVFRNVLPNENTIYFGDLKNMPYGNKSKEELIGFATKILEFFKAKDVKAVVIACNTSSAVAYDTVKDKFDFPIYPIIQSCAKVISQNGYSCIGVFATPATIKSGAYKRELQKYNENVFVNEMACQNWTGYVEGGNFDKKEIIEDVKKHLDEMMEFRPEKIILGCTHYPYLMSVLTKFVPKDIFTDPAEIFVDFIKSDLLKKNLINKSQTVGHEKFYVSANEHAFEKNSKLFYKVPKTPTVVEI